MRKMIVTLCSGALVLGGLTLAARAADEAAKPIEGELVDTHCYSKSKGKAKGEGHAKCGEKCAASGIPVAVVVGEKAWILATNPAPLASAVGKQVRVTGTQNEATQTIVTEKVEVKEGEEWKEIKMKDAHH